MNLFQSRVDARDDIPEPFAPEDRKLFGRGQLLMPQRWDLFLIKAPWDEATEEGPLKEM